MTIRYLSLCFLCLTGLCAWGQDMSAKLQSYRDFCMQVDKGFSQKSNELLMECIEECVDDEFIFHGDTIQLTELLRFEEVDTVAKAPTKGHIVFVPQYVDSILVAGLVDSPERFDFLSGAELTKRAGMVDVCYRHCALKARGKGVYAIKASGRMEVMVFAEKDGRVNLSVCDERNQKNLSDCTQGGKQTAYVGWDMERFGRVVITVENATDKEVAFVIATN